MNRNKLLYDINMLKEKKLNHINEDLNIIYLTDLDMDKGKYYIKSHNKKISKNLDELDIILNELLEFGYANIELLLGNNTPLNYYSETIFLNLPYIEYFKYKNKTYLLFLKEETHTLGTIKEVSGKTLKKARSAIISKERLNYNEIYENLFTIKNGINHALQDIYIKYPGEIKKENISEYLQKLSFIEEEFSQIFFNFNEKKDLLYKNKNHLSHSKNSNDDDDDDDDDDDVNNNLSHEKNSNDKFNRKNLKIRQLTMSFSLIYDRIQYKEIELQPDFQRKERVWSQKEKSLLIESILLGLPIPMFYFAERENGTWLIVDGLQRTTTIFDYMRGEFILTDLKYFNDPEDFVYRKSFEDLPRQYQRKIREYQINGHLISVEKNDFEMVRELFQRINTYGRALSPQEIRCALNPGASVPFIRYLAETQEFTGATFNKINSKRMKDMEYVLGIISFILFGYKHYDYDKEDNFLINTMRYLNKYKFKLIGNFSNDENQDLPIWKNDECSDIFRTIFEKFKKGLKISEELFGSNRFKKNNTDTINKQLLIMFVSVFSLLHENAVNKLKEKRELFNEKFNDLLNGDISSYVPWISDNYNLQHDRDFYFSISQSTGKKATILYRFENLIKLIQDVTGMKIKITGIYENEIK